jgi:hypothetical protein
VPDGITVVLIAKIVNSQRMPDRAKHSEYAALFEIIYQLFGNAL